MAFAVSAQAETTDEATASATAETSVSGEATAGEPAAGAAEVTAGMPLKDSAGVTIGEVAAVEPDSEGKSVATISMGADTFAVDASTLAVADGAATINASQDEVRQMLKK